MKFEKIYLSETNENITLDCYLYTPSESLPSLKTRPAVVVCPGGGYNICSDREADPIAMCYLAAGYHVFLLRYSIENEAVYPNSLVDLCHAMKIIRDHADEWGVKKDEIAVCGFSAGGHLAASLGVHFTEERIQAASGCSVEEIRPNALILGYPVISTSWMENSGSLNRIIGDGDYEQTYRDLNLHTCVNEATPPSFLAHTFRDRVVPVTDSLKFAVALDEKKIPFELHIFPNGGHGMSLANHLTPGGGDDASFAEWMGLSIRWLDRLFRNSEEAAAEVLKANYSSKL
ncbi:MAG: alpha/beta hydrolase [Clostridia bacterium]|nr:alpha/beta hydrolase [Clostridia bacterium]